MSKKMTQKIEGFYVGKAQMRWLNNAAGQPDYGRPVLERILLERTADGEVTLVATDTHRMHILTLAPADGKETSAARKLIRGSWLLNVMGFFKASAVLISPDLDRIDLLNSSDTVLQAARGAWDTEEEKQYPDWRRIVPTSTVPLAQLYGINPKYLVQAVEPGKTSGVVLEADQQGSGPLNRPIVVRPNHEEQNWKAVIMPMAFRGDGR